MKQVGILFIYLLFSLCLGPAVEAGNQTISGQGTVYITRMGEEPDGAILTPIDLNLSLYTAIVDRLSFPETVICAPNGDLYFTETFSHDSVGAAASILIHDPNRIVGMPAQIYHRVARVTPNGSAPKYIIEWDDKSLQPSTLALAPNGDLFIGTTSKDDQPTKGVWRVRGASQSTIDFNMPEQILPPSLFGPPKKGISNSVRPLGFLNNGDLLIIDAPVEMAPGGRVLRAIAPSYNMVVPFIMPFDNPETRRPFKPSGLAVTQTGTVLVTDFSNDKILHYDAQGNFIEVFAELGSPNQIAIGPDGWVYVTNLRFRGRNVNGGLFIYDPQGNLRATDTSSIFLRGIAVCT